MFQPHAGFGAYIEFLKDIVPYGRDPRTPGQAYTRSFKALLESGDLPLNMDTWKAQTGMVFPEVRLNPYLEFRGADSLSPLNSLGLAAFWVGAFADSVTRQKLGEVTHAWSFNDLLTLRSRIPVDGMTSPIAGKTLWTWGEEILPAVAHGLHRRGKGEESFLAPLEHVLTTRTTPADILREKVRTAPSLQHALQDAVQGGMWFLTPQTLCVSSVPQPGGQG
jgi:glutamate--cysteine ligase